MILFKTRNFGQRFEIFLRLLHHYDFCNRGCLNPLFSFPFFILPNSFRRQIPPTLLIRTSYFLAARTLAKLFSQCTFLHFLSSSRGGGRDLKSQVRNNILFQLLLIYARTERAPAQRNYKTKFGKRMEGKVKQSFNTDHEGLF